MTEFAEHVTLEAELESNCVSCLLGCSYSQLANVSVADGDYERHHPGYKLHKRVDQILSLRESPGINESYLCNFITMTI